MPHYRNTDPRFGCTDSIYESPSKGHFANDMHAIFEAWAMEAHDIKTDKDAFINRYCQIRTDFINALVEVTDERA